MKTYKMKAQEIIYFIAIFLAIFFGFLTLFLAIDLFTIKESVDTYEKPCIDNNGYKFINELCEYKEDCSFFGLASNNRCSNVNSKNYRSIYFT